MAGGMEYGSECCMQPPYLLVAFPFPPAARLGRLTDNRYSQTAATSPTLRQLEQQSYLIPTVTWPAAAIPRSCAGRATFSRITNGLAPPHSTSGTTPSAPQQANTNS